MQASGSVVIVTTDGGAADRSALATVRALGETGHRVVVAASAGHSLAAASRFASSHVEVPQPDDPAYPASINRLERAHGSIAVFATSDRALVALEPATAVLVDKRQLAGLALDAGLSMPKTIEFNSAGELLAAAERLGYPMIVKPHIKVPGGPTATRVDAKDELAEIGFIDGLAQPCSTGPMRAIAGVMWRGRIVAALQQQYVRTFPPRAGTASFAFTCQEDEDTLRRIGALLSGHDGVFQAQFVGPDLIDLNPRPYGSMPLATAAGVNLPDIVCRLRSNLEVAPRRAAHGVRYRWIDGDYRSIARAVRSRRMTKRAALAAMFPKRGTTHSIANLRDPRPLAVRLSRLLERRRG